MSILEFQGDYRFLSNFYPSKTLPPTVEHHYQAAKCAVDKERQMVMACQTPGDAKRAGRRVVIRKDWDELKDEIMLQLVREKFNEPELAARLLKTGRCLIMEGNHWGDRYWGAVRDSRGQWRGQNRLGEILMTVRRELEIRQGL